MAIAKIYVVEDNASDVFILRRALAEQSNEFEIETVSDGEQAIRFFQNQQNNPRESDPTLILLDLHLPKHDGLEVLRLLRQQGMVSGKVIVMTTTATPLEVEEIKQLGAEYRTKPKGLSEFETLAADLIKICKESKKTFGAGGH